MNRWIFNLALVGVISPSLAIAQGDVSASEREEVIVYGTRLEQSATEVGSSVSIITANDIEALGVDFVLDAIAAAPGVTINQNGTFGGSASIRIRGAGSEQTLVIIDGVVTNDPTSPGGGYDFARLDPANIERIEILKGPQSTLWGSDAIGGVVNIITKRPKDGLGGNVNLQAGSFGLLRGGVEVSGATDVYDFRVSVTDVSTDGISKADEINGNTEDDGYDATTISATGAIGFGNNAALRATLIWTDADSEFDSFSFGAQGNVGDGAELSTNEELTTNLMFDLPLLDGRLENTFLVGFSEVDRENFTDGLSMFSSEGDRTTFRYQGNYAFNEANELAMGIEREDSESNGEDTSIDGLFALYEFQPIDVLTITAGIRRDDHERFGAETTSRLAAAYNPTEQLTVRASWGEGFKAPTLFQTTFFCCGAVAPNANLLPEVSDAFDIGFSYRTADGRGDFGLTYFDQDTTNLITFSFAIGGYENIATAESSGIELQASYQLNDWATVSAGFANIDAVDGSGARLPRVPENSGDLTFTLDPVGPFSGSVLLRYNGDEEDPNGSVRSWTRVDLAGRLNVSERTEVFARIENLLDREYQQILGYGTPGISGTIGAKVSF